MPKVLRFIREKKSGNEGGEILGIFGSHRSGTESRDHVLIVAKATWR